MTAAVSVILPTFDRLELLRDAVASVRAQTFDDWELIVVDDGSTDATREWLASLGDPRIVTIARPHVGNDAVLRNAGLARATAPWIAFIDSDDLWMPEKLALQVALHDGRRGLAWSYTNRVMIDLTGRPLDPSSFQAWQPHDGWLLDDVLELRANIALPSVMVQRDALLAVGGFDERWRAASDYELWLRLAERYECGVITTPLVQIRSHQSSTFGRPDVNLGLADMYRSFAERTADDRRRAIATRREAIHAIAAANVQMNLRDWNGALASVLRARARQPLAPFVYRAFARLLWRRARARVAGNASA